MTCDLRWSIAKKKEDFEAYCALDPQAEPFVVVQCDSAFPEWDTTQKKKSPGVDGGAASPSGDPSRKVRD